MNKSHLTAKGGSRALSPIAASAVRQLSPGPDELDDVSENPWMPSVFDDQASEWPEVETGTAYAGSGYREQADDSLARDVETGINMLLHGVSYR